MKQKLLGIKRTVMFLTTCMILLMTTLTFYSVWNNYYSNSIVLPFYYKGNILVVIVYAILLYVFTKIYSGYKVGVLKFSELVY